MHQAGSRQPPRPPPGPAHDGTRQPPCPPAPPPGPAHDGTKQPRGCPPQMPLRPVRGRTCWPPQPQHTWQGGRGAEHVGQASSAVVCRGGASVGRTSSAVVCRGGVSVGQASSAVVCRGGVRVRTAVASQSSGVSMQGLSWGKRLPHLTISPPKTHIHPSPFHLPLPPRQAHLPHNHPSTHWLCLARAVPRHRCATASTCASRPCCPAASTVLQAASYSGPESRASAARMGVDASRLMAVTPRPPGPVGPKLDSRRG